MRQKTLNGIVRTRTIKKITLHTEDDDDTKIRDVVVDTFEEYADAEGNAISSKTARARPEGKWVADLRAAYEKLRA